VSGHHLDILTQILPDFRRHPDGMKAGDSVAAVTNRYPAHSFLPSLASHLNPVDFPATSGIMPLHRGDLDVAPFPTNPDPQRTEGNSPRHGLQST
jgi:hypothetical protein